MSTSTAISIKNISKRYEINQGEKRMEFTALDDLNITIQKGEVLGIIGANGAGKSTLLKILSRITYPSEGEVVVNYPLASLLEVGTGFHPELSGRENIFLNGAILGMSRREIKARFEEIVEFSGVEKFLDTPVKHYSSGMYVRLAFSVAAHLSAEIILIDEVLAVGDAEFQQKCLRKMDEASSSEGRTVLFVSHNLSAVRQLCQRVIWLEKGRIREDGDSEKVTATYLKSLDKKADQIPVGSRDDRKGSGEVKIRRIEWQSKDDILISGRPVALLIDYYSESAELISNLNFRLNVYKQNGEYLTTLSNDWGDTPFNKIPNLGRVECRFEQLPFLAGDYYITTNLFVNGIKIDKVEKALNFSVKAGDFHTKGALKTRERPGILVSPKWSFEQA